MRGLMGGTIGRQFTYDGSFLKQWRTFYGEIRMGERTMSNRSVGD